MTNSKSLAELMLEHAKLEPDIAAFESSILKLRHLTENPEALREATGKILGGLYACLSVGATSKEVQAAAVQLSVYTDKLEEFFPQQVKAVLAHLRGLYDNGVGKPADEEIVDHLAVLIAPAGRRRAAAPVESNFG